METALANAAILIITGICAALIIHFIFRYFQNLAEKTDLQIEDLLVHSLGAPLVILAFFIPLFLAIQHTIHLHPQFRWIADSKILFSGYIIVTTGRAVAFIDGFLNTYGRILAGKTDTEIDDKIIEILQKIAKYLI